MNTLHQLLQGANPQRTHLGEEGFVLLTLGFFGGMILAILCSAWVLHRRATRPKPHLELLLELQEEEQKTATEAKGAPWERSSDWWKE